MTLMDDEKILFESDNKQFVLTTNRIRNKTKSWGKAYLTSIMLEEICSCSIKYKSLPILLILGILVCGILIVTGGAENNSGAIVTGVVVLLIFLLLYAFSKKQMLSISSGRDSIYLVLSSNNLDDLIKLVDAIESAKNNRYFSVG